MKAMRETHLCPRCGTPHIDHALPCPPPPVGAEVPRELKWGTDLPQQCGWWWRLEDYKKGRCGHAYRVRIERFNFNSGPLIVFGRTSFGFDLLSAYEFRGWWAGPHAERLEAPPVESRPIGAPNKFTQTN